MAWSPLDSASAFVSDTAVINFSTHCWRCKRGEGTGCRATFSKESLAMRDTILQIKMIVLKASCGVYFVCLPLGHSALRVSNDAARVRRPADDCARRFVQAAGPRAGAAETASRIALLPRGERSGKKQSESLAPNSQRHSLCICISISSRCIALHITLRCVALHCIALHYVLHITLRFLTRPRLTLSLRPLSFLAYTYSLLVHTMAHDGLAGPNSAHDGCFRHLCGARAARPSGRSRRLPQNAKRGEHSSSPTVTVLVVRESDARLG